jgi:F-type H+-transporting ATPase subunit epsilon
MADMLAVEVVTPEQTLLAGAAVAVVLRTSEGSLTVLPGFAPFVGDVVAGEVKVEQPDGVLVRLAVHGGFVQVDTSAGAADGVEGVGDGPISGVSTRVTVLAGVAELVDEIDVARADAAKTAALARLDQLKASSSRDDASSDTDFEIAQLESAIARADVRLKLAGVPASTS